MRDGRLRLPGEAVRPRRGRACCSSACSRCRRCGARTATCAARSRRRRCSSRRARRCAACSQTARAGRGVRRDRAAHRRERHRARTCSRAAIHAWSPRATGPFVAISCTTLVRAPARERAVRPREGRVHRRVEGQARAARGRRAAARSSSTRSASCRPTCRRSCCASSRSAASSASAATTTREVDVRIIAATNRDLEAEVRAGPLPRRTSSTACNVIGIALPPLRERREDLPALVDHLLRSLCARHRAAARGARPRGARRAARLRAGRATCASW